MCKDEKDFYLFEAPTPGVIRVIIDPIPPGILRSGFKAWVTAEVSNAAQEQIGSGRTLLQERNRLAFTTLVGEGKHFASIAGENYVSDETYTLKVALDTTDGFEINNSFFQAALINLGQQVIGTIQTLNDEDFFVFEVPTRGVIEVTIEPVPSEVDPSGLDISLWAEVFDAEQRRLAGRGTLPGTRLNFNVDIVSSGRHFVRVFGERFRSDEPYSLSVQQQ